MNKGEGKIFFGWYMVAVCFAVNLIVFGISVNTFTVYVKPITTDMSWSRAKFSLGMTLASLVMGIMAPLVGRIIDRIGARIAMAVGISIIGICTLALSGAKEIYQFYLLYMLSGAGQAAATLIPISMVISNWFNLKRGRALGIVMTGTGIGTMIMVPITSWIVVNFGWRTSYFIMGWLILSMAPLCLILIKTRPSDMGLKPDGGMIEQTIDYKAVLEGVSLKRALKSRAFWLILSMMFIFGMVGMGIGLHLMPYLTDIGHTEIIAGLIISGLSALTVAGKVGMGFIADRWGIRKVLVLTCILIIFGILTLAKSQIMLMAVIFAILYGLSIGTPLLINPALTAECFGLANFGAIFGVLSLFNILGAGIGASLTGLIYDKAGSYFPAFWLYIFLLAVAVFCGVSARKIEK